MIKRFFSLKYKFLIFVLVLNGATLILLGSVAYTTASKVVTEKVSAANLVTIRQIGNNIDNILQSIHETSLHFIQNQQLRETLLYSQAMNGVGIERNKIALTQFLLNYISLNPYIDSIKIWNDTGITVSTDWTPLPQKSEFEQKIIGLRGSLQWIIDGWKSLDGSYFNYVSLARAINNFNDISELLGIMMINVREEHFYEIYRNAKIAEHGNFYLIDKTGILISSLDRDQIGNLFQAEYLNDSILQNHQDGYFNRTIKGENYLITFYRLTEADWLLVNVILLQDLVKDNRFIQKFILVVMGLSIIASFIFTFLFSNRMLTPLNHMGLLMKEIEKNHFNVHLPLKGNDEISLLSDTFNKMSKRLKELMDQVYFVQIKQREAELMALEAQINPHFLYNSMDTIYWSSLMEKANGTSELIKALANFFRLSINSGQDITSLAKEVAHLENFIIIEKARYEEMIDFQLDFDEKLLDCRVVKLVLQPLVENAIQHGIEKKGEAGRIHIRIMKKDSKLIYYISDTGIGANESDLNDLLLAPQDQNRGVGIKNVNDRIKLHFGEEYGLSFSSSLNAGTTVIVTQPYIQEKTNVETHSG